MSTPPRRRDAARNQDRILAVARELVDEGVPLQLNDVARRAGLGVGTVYRHFPTPEALLETVATPRLTGLAEDGERALAEPDAWLAFSGFLGRVVEAQFGDAALSPVTAAAEDALPATTELKRTLWTVGAELLARVKAAGEVRADLSADDLVPLMCGIAYAATVHGGEDRVATAHRYLATMLAGLRARR
ncbi:AcrR family transcriptional regulator [Crossiella equi]|uniref:AcrR family transcriptional regulator n=1 Tax=Crossiella equi TaxID=130796 RepID=A0ABS5ANN1_9PSEU|nr:TetR/AcrR family transcriptional regulator [Crossiella equi]MBP2478183.1 AcrR family transcriptional regulator [Crossiella equi]